MNILLADDDKAIRESLSELLTMLGHRVTALESGEQVIEYLKTNKPHLILTDFNMGEGMNGHDVLVEAKKIYLDVQVVIMTAFASITSAVKSVKEGAYEYLAKPLDISDIEKLLNKIQDVINGISFSLESLEKDHIRKILNYAPTFEVAADLLGINMSTLWRKRKTYGMTT